MILIGFKNCGKSTLGKLLAEKMQWDFIDTDDLFGAPVRELYQQLGEAAFRDLEEKIIAELTPSKNRVIATGGGSILRAANVKKFKTLGPMIYLRADKEKLRHADLPDFLQENFDVIYDARELIYQRSADRTINIEGLNNETILQQLVRAHHGE